MAYKDILAPCFGDAADESLIAVLESLESFAGAHVAAALVWPIYLPVFTGDPMSGELMLGELMQREQAEAGKAMEALKRRLAKTDLAVELRTQIGALPTLRDQTAMQARHVDLTVMTRPMPGRDRADFDVLDAALMESGRPVYLAPSDWKPRARPGTILIGWNASREAARTVSDAMPFLTRADKIIVATVDAKPSARGHGESPGVDIATHLARHGLSVDLHNLDSGGDAPAEALLAAARAHGADLIVTGGFGHARLQQALFGGVTKTLVGRSPVPLFLAH